MQGKYLNMNDEGIVKIQNSFNVRFIYDKKKHKSQQ